MLDDRFQKAEDEYLLLRRRFEARDITEEQFERALNDLETISKEPDDVDDGTRAVRMPA